MTRRGLFALGAGQCVNWGVLYYAFAVLLLPVQQQLKVQAWVVTGAFSLALLASAAAAPAIGRWADRGFAARALELGGFGAAALLVGWAIYPSVATLYVAWLGVGLCMAASLYETAFIIVGRSFPVQGERVRALALVTVFGGLASTVFLPLTAWLVAAVGWRWTVTAEALLVAGSTQAVAMTTQYPAMRTDRAAARAAHAPTAPHRGVFRVAMATFAFGTMCSAGLIANLIPALSERSVTPATAAAIGGMFGLMQLPGRALLLRDSGSRSSRGLVALSAVLQGAGLVALALTSSLASVTVAISIFALGSGLSTIARPHFVYAMLSHEHAGALNGRLARAQQLARAAGPVIATVIAAASGYSALYLACGAVFALLSIAWLATVPKSA